MRFKLGNPAYSQYDFYLLSGTPDVQKSLDRLGPVKMISGAYDWPNVFGGYRNWTDQINSLWWPQGDDQFSTCVLLLDDARNDLLASCVSAQRADTPAGEWQYPSFVLSALLSPPEGQRPGDNFLPTGVEPVNVETPLVEWKMYGLAPVNLTSLTEDEKYRGLWLLPLVDLRYLKRNTALNQFGGSSSSSTGGCEVYPMVCTGDDDFPPWMPPLRAWPDDASAPMYYVPIVGNGVSPVVTAPMSLGEAADLQAEMNSLRVVSRDVRSNYSNIDHNLSHKNFTGVVTDYPEDYSAGDPRGYHQDAIGIFNYPGMRLAGGPADPRTLDDFTARKFQFLFETKSSDCFYSITLRTTKDYPTSVSDFAEDVDGPNSTDRQTTPAVLLGLQIANREPSDSERDKLLAAAKQWFLIYLWWRRDQYYMRFPGIVPVIPNGHAQMIRWDFQSDVFQTTYVALEGIEGVTPASRNYSAKRLPFYARIDGEGLVQDGLQGFYAYTEMIDQGGMLVDGGDDVRQGFVAGVNGSYVTWNPARDESGKVAVPVGLIVWLKPGKVYLDTTTGQCFDHYLFTTTDLMQVVRIKLPVEINGNGHYRIIIKTWREDLNKFINSKEAWAVILRDEDQ
jgi:hypothetical protein